MRRTFFVDRAALACSNLPIGLVRMRASRRHDAAASKPGLASSLFRPRVAAKSPRGFLSEALCVGSPSSPCLPRWRCEMGIVAWIILGLLAGILAKVIMPGKDPGGFLFTILLGIGGA